MSPTKSEGITPNAVCWKISARMKVLSPGSLIWYHLFIKREEKDVAFPDYHKKITAMLIWMR